MEADSTAKEFRNFVVLKSEECPLNFNSFEIHGRCLN